MSNNSIVLTNTSKYSEWTKLLFKLLSNIEFGSLKLFTPEGEVFHFNGTKKNEVQVELIIKDWRVSEYLFTKGDIGLGESYIEGFWESSHIENLIEFGVLNSASLEKVIKGSLLKIIFYRLKHMLNRNSVKGSAKNIHAHYDLGNSFYSLWLDKSMTYSSAIFDEDLDLYSAQQKKYERIFKRLNAKPGDHVLEIGCGWGGFAEYACSRGLKVTAVTISNEQFKYAKDRLKPYGNFAKIELCDYRNIKGKFDFIVSIEMFEALGESYWPKYFSQVNKLLSPKGTAVIQTITINDEDFKSYRKGTDFIQQYIFPGGMLPSPSVFEKVSKASGLSISGKFEFGLSYAKTLKVWESNFRSCLADVRKIGFDERFIRTWEFYLKYCEGAFLVGKTNVIQYVLRKA